jgi:hypothetical protein
MIELAHYSTFDDEKDFLSNFKGTYCMGIQASYMGIDNRTEWTKKFLSTRAEKILSVQFNVDTCSLHVNGDQINAREFKQKLERPSSKPLIDATSLEYPEIQYLFYWLHEIQCSFDVLYVEPEHYSSNNTKGTRQATPSFALSEDGPGVLQLPPFIGSTQNETINVISMGFEGHRVAGLLNNDQLQDPGFDEAILVIGVPAFKAGFDQISIKCNSIALKQIQKLPKSSVIFSAANNSHSMMIFLEKLQKSLLSSNSEFPTKNINLIPFGTKPSAIGMAWFAVNHQENTIVTYDYIKKLSGRSSGVGKIHLAQFE